MKKMLITMICALAILSTSLIGCQVYDPTDNEPIYTAMRSQGATSLENYFEAFEQADAEGKNEFIMEYSTTIRGEYLPQFGSKIIAKYGASFMDCVVDYPVFAANCGSNWLEAYKALLNICKAKQDIVDTKGTSATEGEKQALADAKSAVIKYSFSLLDVMWQKRYHPKWDWNGKL